MKKNNSPRSDLPVTRLSDGVYLLNEFDGTNCYLVTGKEKALLIDCGTGFCNLKSAVKKITELPIIVVATHGHVDHIGGMWQFPEIYIHKDDCKFLNTIHASTIIRKIFTQSNGAVKAHGISQKDIMSHEYKTKIIPFDEKMTFDLGEKTITVKHTKGHTIGSVALIDETDKIIFSGDNVCDALWMQLPGATSIEEWLPSAEWLFEMSKSYRIFWGHREPQLKSDYISQIIQWGKEILQSYKSNRFPSIITQYPKREDGIIFRTGHIFKK